MNDNTICPEILYLQIGKLINVIKMNKSALIWILFVLYIPSMNAQDFQNGMIIRFQPLALERIVPEYLPKIEKGNLAWNSLKTHNLNQMKVVKQYLSDRGFSFKVYDINSSIFVPRPDINLINFLKNRTEIIGLSDNFQIRMSPDIDRKENEARASTWGLILTGAEQLHQEGIIGVGAVVGGNDTGVEWTHDGLKKTYRGWDGVNANHNYNWHDAIHENSPLSDTSKSNPCGLSLKYPCDDNSHGTHTVGTMTGKLDDLVTGMAPGAKWVATRNMERGNGSLQTYLEAFNWFLAPTDTNDLNPTPALSPDVINNSWYCSVSEGCDSTNWNQMQIVAENLRAAGIMVVASAGNDGPSCNTIRFTPAMFDAVYTVGSTMSNDTISGFSSRGWVIADHSNRMKPDITAPGSGVYSTVLGNAFGYKSGTSMAGPHVAGLVALMIGANPDLAGHIDTIEAIINRTAVQKFSDQICSGIAATDIPNPVYGHGRINAYAAVKEGQKYVAFKNKSKVFNDLKVTPNPVTHEALIKIQPNQKVTEINIINHLGQIIQCPYNIAPNTISINTKELTSGVYIIVSKTNDSILVGKMIKL